MKPWAELPDSHRRFACRLQEAFAAFLDHTDDQIGRLVDGLRQMDQLDNTILIVLADNGASQEGGPLGVMHEMKYFNGIVDDPDDVMDRLDDIGGPNSPTNYPWGWAQCGNSPFKWYKQNTHEGGVHVPLVLHWPGGIAGDQRGTRREQFVNVSDVAPTVYELVGITPPDVFRGYAQLPVTGSSFASVLADADVPATNTLQYFEQSGSRALVVEQDGVCWKAVTRHIKGESFDDDRWELYELSSDRSECNDLAEIRPDKLDELIGLWWAEAERHGVLPLDDRMIELFVARRDDHSPHPTNRRYRYRPPMSPIPSAASASPSGRSWELTAQVSRGADDAGVLWATGNANSGMSVFVQNGRLVVDYNSFGEHTVVESELEVPAGDCVLTARLRRTSRTEGVIELAIDGEPCGSAELPYMMQIISSIGSSVGLDHGQAVSPRYEAPFAFSGALHAVEIDRSGASRTEAETAARTEMARQ